MAETLTPEICVIGAGAGGWTVAAAAAACGVATVLIDKRPVDGGGLGGALPSKALLAAARRAQAVRSGAPFGVAAAVTVDFDKVRRHVREVIAAVTPAQSSERLAGLGARVIRGHARFRDHRTVVVGEEYEIRARRFVVATGSAPVVPAILGIDQGPYLTSDTIFDLSERPARLLVIGAGPAGLELAQAFRRLGSEVTVLEAAAPLANDDAECAAIVRDQLEREGVVVHAGVKPLRVTYTGGSVAAAFAGNGGEETLQAEALLVAAGRTPNTGGLALEAAGIRFDQSGIQVNKQLRTSNRRVYAIGDVAAGQSQFGHTASYHAELVIQNALFRRNLKVDDGLVPRVTFTEPELAHVGLTEAQARDRKLKFRVLRWPYFDNDRAQAERTTHGHIKVITSVKGKILGATIVGAQAGELIAMWSLAIAQGLNIRALAGTVLPYPTLSEAGKRAAIDFFLPDLTSTPLRRIIARLRIFG